MDIETVTKLKRFIPYFLAFYDEKTGLCPIKGLTIERILEGIELRLKNCRIPFDGDSTDRELVRDMLLAMEMFKWEGAKKQ